VALAAEETLLTDLRCGWYGLQRKRNGFSYEQKGSAMSAVFVRRRCATLAQPVVRRLFEGGGTKSLPVPTVPEEVSFMEIFVGVV
jgi:hypothetical protein